MANRSHKIWTPQDKQNLKSMARRNFSTGKIAKNLGRTKSSVYHKASELHVSLEPKDK